MAQRPDPVEEEPLLLPALPYRHTGDKETKRSTEVNTPLVNVPLWSQSIRDQVAATGLKNAASRIRDAGLTVPVIALTPRR